MILYPTETLYALGVNALDRKELKKLYKLKGRDSSQTASWLVRSVKDIERYAELSLKAAKIAEQFLLGPLTLVLKIKEELLNEWNVKSDNEVSITDPDGTIGFRVSTDPIARQVIEAFMEQYNAPLTCTSANVHGSPVFPTPSEILQQFGKKASMIDEIMDDGPRKGLASTVVRVVGDEMTVLREGEISERDIMDIVR